MSFPSLSLPGRIDTAMTKLTRILESEATGDPQGADGLLPLVYDELRRLAAARMAGERSDHTLQATDLVHEAWIKLAGADGEGIAWNGRRHFYAAAAKAMRRILVDHARRKNSRKRGGDWLRITFGDHEAPRSATPPEMIDLNDALDKLCTVNSEMAEVAKLRLFGELTVAESAAALGVSEPTIKRRWRSAKAWLSRELKRGDLETK
jgi:RNA polymerase sigma factor (TIGR02999 family)